MTKKLTAFEEQRYFKRKYNAIMNRNGIKARVNWKKDVEKIVDAGYAIVYLKKDKKDTETANMDVKHDANRGKEADTNRDGQKQNAVYIMRKRKHVPINGKFTLLTFSYDYYERLFKKGLISEPDFRYRIDDLNQKNTRSPSYISLKEKLDACFRAFGISIALLQTDANTYNILFEDCEFFADIIYRSTMNVSPLKQFKNARGKISLEIAYKLVPDVKALISAMKGYVSETEYPRIVATIKSNVEKKTKIDYPDLLCGYELNQIDQIICQIESGNFDFKEKNDYKYLVKADLIKAKELIQKNPYTTSDAILSSMAAERRNELKSAVDSYIKQYYDDLKQFLEYQILFEEPPIKARYPQKYNLHYESFLSTKAIEDTAKALRKDAINKSSVFEEIIHTFKLNPLMIQSTEDFLSIFGYYNSINLKLKRFNNHYSCSKKVPERIIPYKGQKFKGAVKIRNIKVPAYARTSALSYELIKNQNFYEFSSFIWLCDSNNLKDFNSILIQQEIFSKRMLNFKRPLMPADLLISM